MTSPDLSFETKEPLCGSLGERKIAGNGSSTTCPDSEEPELRLNVIGPVEPVFHRFALDGGEGFRSTLRSRWAIVAVTALMLFILPGFLQAQQLDCLACHGTSGMKDASGHSISINASVFHSSIHSSLGCAACHSDIKTFPHPAHIAPVDCAKCHASEASGLAGSVHAHDGKHPCLSCHGNPHAIVPVTDPHSPVYPLNVPHTCGQCHGNPAIAKKYHLKNVYGEYVDSIHGLAVTKDGLLVAANCSSCHGTHHILSHTNPKSSTYRTNIPATCGKCHAGIEAKYLAGTHGKAMLSGNTKAPVCVSCHTAHRIVEPQETAFQENTVGKCGGCHKEKYATYRDTFHAQVSALGYVEVAHCWDCHGPHEVLPASDPRSPVNRANLVKTCGKCHANANIRFVSYQPHANPYDFHSDPVLYSIRLFMTLLLWSVLGFFAIHSILWFIRLRVARQRQRPSQEEDHE